MVCLFLSLVFLFLFPFVARKLYFSKSSKVRIKLKNMFPLLSRNDFSTWHLANFFISLGISRTSIQSMIARVLQFLKACVLFRVSIRTRTLCRGRKKKKNSRAALIFVARQKTVANLLSGGVGRLHYISSVSNLLVIALKDLPLFSCRGSFRVIFTYMNRRFMYDRPLYN